MRFSAIFAFACIAAMISPAFASEKRLKKADVPAVVLAAVVARYPKATLTEFAQEDEAGKTVYEVQLKVGKAKTELIVSPDGKILTEEKTITRKELPAAVDQALTKSPYAKAKIIKIEMVTDGTKPDLPSYEIFVKQKSQVHELVFTATGKLTKDETEDAD